MLKTKTTVRSCKGDKDFETETWKLGGIPENIFDKQHIFGKLLDVQLLGCEKRYNQGKYVFSSEFNSILKKMYGEPQVSHLIRYHGYKSKLWSFTQVSYFIHLLENCVCDCKSTHKRRCRTIDSSTALNCLQNFSNSELIKRLNQLC